jgi:hypothetical protein
MSDHSITFSDSPAIFDDPTSQTGRERLNPQKAAAEALSQRAHHARLPERLGHAAGAK